ncbi:MAG: hypothetical protein JO061_13155 [Acidobacteriaceae bacterium]|nr:hypothetical protein [Acidobacteriaceae bacterium]
MNEFDQLRLKLITDQNFRNQLMQNPSSALQSVGIQPSEDILQVLTNLKKDLEELARIFDTTIDSV